MHLQSKRLQVLEHHGQMLHSLLTGCLPFIHDDHMPGSGTRLRRSGDKTRLDEKLLLWSGFGRNLEIDNLPSFINIRFCSTSPGCCRDKHNAKFISAFKTALASRDIDINQYSRFTALMSKLATQPSCGLAVETALDLKIYTL